MLALVGLIRFAAAGILALQIKKIEVSQHSRYFCSFCGKVGRCLAHTWGHVWCWCGRLWRACLLQQLLARTAAWQGGCRV